MFDAEMPFDPIPQNLTRRAAIQAAVLSAGTSLSQPAQAAADRPRIRIGQIGVGHAHASKLSVYRNSPDYEVIGIVEPDEELRKRAENETPFRGLKWLTRDELLATPGLQAVLVETHVRHLLDHAEACLSAGMHVHIDKPAGDSLSHLRRIFEIAARKNLIVQMGYMYRYNPAVVLLREFLHNGFLGEVFEVHAVMSKVVATPDRKAFAAYRGGMMFELGCHLVDLIVGVLGKPEKVTGFPRHSSKIEDSLADNTLAVLEYPKATATIRSTALEVEGFGRRHLVVCGTGGTFHIQPLDDPSARISLAKDCGKYKRGTHDIAFPKYVRYVDDAADMARIIRGEKASCFSPFHDLAVQETLLRACGQPLD